MESTQLIQVIVENDELRPGKGLLESAASLSRKVITLDTDQLAKNIAILCGSVDEMLKGIRDSLTEYKLDTLEISVDVTAKGELRLIGSAGAEAKGGLKLVFRRK